MPSTHNDSTCLTPSTTTGAPERQSDRLVQPSRPLARLLGVLGCFAVTLVGTAGVALAEPPTVESVSSTQGSGRTVLIQLEVCNDENECTTVSVGVDGRDGFWVVETTDSEEPDGPSSSASGNAGDSKFVQPDGPSNNG